jgi:serine/threonine-protein kinase SRK2
MKYVAREIFNHRLLCHPHIVSFKEVFLITAPTPLDTPYLAIVMEYVGGGNLQTYVTQKGRLPEWQARCFFQQLILALHYSHKHLNISHRDIKLGNIILNTKYQVPILKLCDFGYSKRESNASLAKTAVGTAAYVSPEVAHSGGTSPYDSEKADVWSSGVTLFCMLTGTYPFLDKDNTVTLQTIQRLTQQEAEAVCEGVTNVSPECKDLLSQLIVVDPNNRFNLTQIMQHPWFVVYLPDISKLIQGAQQLFQQSDKEIYEILEKAGRLASVHRDAMMKSGGDVLGGEVIDAESEDAIVDEIMEQEEEEEKEQHDHHHQ